MQKQLILHIHFSIIIPLRLYDVIVNDVVVRVVTSVTVTGDSVWTETEAV